MLQRREKTYHHGKQMSDRKRSEGEHHQQQEQGDPVPTTELSYRKDG